MKDYIRARIVLHTLANEVPFDDNITADELVKRLRSRNMYSDHKPCLEKLILLRLKLLLSNRAKVKNKHLEDYINSVLKHSTKKCKEIEKPFARTLRIIKHNLEVADKIMPQIEKKLKARKNLVVSMKVSEETFGLIEDVQRLIGGKRGLKSAVLKKLIEALMSDDPERTMASDV